MWESFAKSDKEKSLKYGISAYLRDFFTVARGGLEPALVSPILPINKGFLNCRVRKCERSCSKLLHLLQDLPVHDLLLVLEGMGIYIPQCRVIRMPGPLRDIDILYSHGLQM